MEYIKLDYYWAEILSGERARPEFIVTQKLKTSRIKIDVEIIFITSWILK